MMEPCEMFDSDGEFEDRSNSSSQFNTNGSMEEVMLTCERCGRQGPGSQFYGKKRYCSFSCSRPSVMAKKIEQKKNQKKIPGSFDWRKLLDTPDFDAGFVQSFKFAPLSEWWARNVTIGMKVEVQNHDAPEHLQRVVYWVATICDVKGYFVKLRYVGFDDDSEDFWANLCYIQDDDLHIVDNSVHHVGWCAINDKPLVPPKTVQDKTENWKHYMVQKLTGSKTLPHGFHNVVREKLKSRLEVGMKLEAIDKTRLSSLRVAIIHKIVGRRLYIRYERMDDDDEGFWFHEKSQMIHPVGWARVHGHELLSTEEYARSSLTKALSNKFGPKDASWSHFDPLTVPNTIAKEHDEAQFEVGMKLEVIDPLNLAMISIGTVQKVLRNHYLMIGIDGATNPNGSDLLCYHAASPQIFPAGFCKLFDIPLKPPFNYKKKEFIWEDYLEETESKPAPNELFKRVLPVHEFKAGQYVEAVDLINPKLICVARITRVVDRLVRIHFEGWDESYDQWLDCDSPDIFPIGWCDIVGYLLTPPQAGSESQPTTHSSAVKKRREVGGGNRKKKRKSIKEPSSQVNTADEESNTKPDDKQPDHMNLTDDELVKLLISNQCSNTANALASGKLTKVHLESEAALIEVGVDAEEASKVLEVLNSLSTSSSSS